MIHFVEEGETKMPRRGLFIVRDKGVSELHLVLAFKWPVRRWFASDYDRMFVWAKPMPFVRIALRRTWGNSWRSWLLARFDLARGVEYTDIIRWVPMTREQVNVTHIHGLTDEEFKKLPKGAKA